MSTPPSFTPTEVAAYYAARVPDLAQRGVQWRGACPIHHGTNDNFAVEAATGRWICHSQCGRGGDVLELERALTGAAFPVAKAEVFRIMGRAGGQQQRHIVATYDYTDEQGELLFQVCRFEPKDFRCRRPDGKGGWIWNLRGVQSVLYNLPEVLAENPVFIVEGEKDADTVRSFGFCATCNAGGAGKWRGAYAEALRGKLVCIIPDKDKPGYRHAANVAESLLPVALSVHILELPGERKDISSWVDAGGSSDEFRRLASATPELIPEGLTALCARWGVPDKSKACETSEPAAASGTAIAPAKASGLHDRVLNVADLLALDVPPPAMLIEGFLPTAGACLMFGAAKSGKTLLSVQVALAVASGRALFDYYRILEPGPALMVEQDDPAGAGSLKVILERSAAPVDSVPFYLAPRLPFGFGPDLLGWLAEQIESRGLRLLVLDSYTALRGPRAAGIDIVKAEQTDLNRLDELAKKTGCCILVIHHSSKGAAGLDWNSQAAGTFAMSAATEAQIHISRFSDLDTKSPERLVRVRGRHLEGSEMVLRFRPGSLDYEHLIEGGASPIYPLILEFQMAFGDQSFGPKELAHATGVSRATANRQIDRLFRAGVLTKRGFGEYVIGGR